MSQQACLELPAGLGNIKMYTFGYRYMPIMTSRAGFAWHNEYSWIRQQGTCPGRNRLDQQQFAVGI